MKDILKITSVVLVCLSLIACQSHPTESTAATLQASEIQINTTSSITLSELRNKLAQKESFFLYVGRPTCPYCRKFQPNLDKAMEETQVSVYYLNTDEEEAKDITDFVDSQGIETIPHLTYYKDGQKSDFLVKGSESSVE
ncbi:thioredoxin [Streptococcus sp. X16XC17]|uniref:thioredoxin domain-containing protein n=1 Tax=unclassified Streptococcus TaxID=2608887 RepID=UPI00069E685B|nr:MULTISPECIES: DUF6568 family protein [unclassified Streptococcus]TCD45982.1 thioredoxin [Streptococcus sp. X16XC17]